MTALKPKKTHMLNQTITSRNSNSKVRILLRFGNKRMAIVFFLVFVRCLCGSVSAQNHVVPQANAPGTPLGSYSLSDIESISLFSGRINATVPIVSVGGRGNAGYLLSIPIKDAHWAPHADRGDVTLLYAVDHPESLQEPGRSVYLQPFEYGTVSVRYSGINPTWPSPYPDGPNSTFQACVVTMVFTSADGTEHQLFDEVEGGNAMELQGQYPDYYWTRDTDRGLVFSAKDGSGWTFVSDPIPGAGGGGYTPHSEISFYPESSPGFVEQSVSGYLKGVDGTVIRFDGSRAQYIRDRNGNKTSFIYESTGPYTLPRLDKIVDTNNRVTDINYGSDYTQINYIGSAGQSRTITVSNQPLSSRLRASSGYSVSTIGQLFPAYPDHDSPYSFDNSGSVYNPSVVSNVELPDGKSYGFYYNPYGELARIELPTGGAFEYDYGSGQPIDYNPVNYDLPVFPSGQIGRIHHFWSQGTSTEVGIYRRILERREYANGGSAVTGKTSYTRWGQVPGVSVDEDRFNPTTGSLLSRQYHYFIGSPGISLIGGGGGIGLTDTLEGREYQTDTLDVSTNVVLARIEHSWNQGCFDGRSICGTGSEPLPWGAFLERTTSSVYDSNIGGYLVSKTEYNYDKYNNVTDISDFDFGSNQVGPLIRRTHTDYLVDSNYINVSGAELRDLPRQIWVSSDALGNNIVSRRMFEYDNYSSEANHASLVPRTNVSGFDAISFGTGNPIRGNVTSIISFANAQAQTDAVAEYSQYDVLGNIVMTVDSNGHATTISYSDNFGSPNAEAITNSAPSQLNGQSTFAFPTYTRNPMNWTTYIQYDYFTGKPVNTQDINGIVSEMRYNDSLDRPTQSTRAVGTLLENQATLSYDDINHKIQRTSDLNKLTDNLIKSESLYDGFGRTVETRSYEANGNFRAVQIQYDALGRACKQSNAFRPNEIDTNHPILWTTTRFDSLGRPTEVETPDGAIVSKSYVGSMVTITDQAGKKRQGISDALGRMREVKEDPDGQNLSTTYVFDPVGNLRKTSQGVQDRYFMYDSLGRLLFAKQVEQDANSNFSGSNFTDPITGNNQWSVKYQYDAVGNITLTTDARNQTIEATYDALDRLTFRNYSDSAMSDVAFTYDDSTILNSKGQLTKVSSSVSETRNTSFDPTGKLLSSQQTTDEQTYNLGYAYNLSGALIEETYPSGRVVKNTLENDGNLSQVQSKKNSTSGYWTFGNSFTYDSEGNVTKLQLGNGHWETAQYNDRLQITQIGLGATSSTEDLLKLEYKYTTATTSHDNNGTLKEQTITVPTVGSISGFVADQAYTYDGLNRLLSAAETISSLQTWKQTFDYDRYGNRRFNVTGGNTTTLGSCSPQVCNPAFPTDSTNRNRFSAGQGYSYDAEGSVTEDAAGQRFSYDSESRQKEFFLSSNSGNTPDGTYFYDGMGHRVKKTTDTEITVFVYDANGKLVSEYSSDLNSVQQVSYLTDDSVGSPRIITNENGAVTSRKDFAAFGDEVTSPQRVGGPLGNGYDPPNIRQDYTGYQKDEETGLEYAQARYFNPQHGRFTTVDPLTASASIRNPQTFNRYSYALNSPYKFSDPLGLAPCDSQDGNPDCKDKDLNENLRKVTTITTTEITIVERGGGQIVREARLLITEKQTQYINEDGNVVEADPTETTATATNTGNGVLNFSKDQLNTMETLGKNIVEVSRAKQFDPTIALGIALTETHMGMLQSNEKSPAKQTDVNPMQLSSTSGISPTTNLRNNISGAIDHFNVSSAASLNQRLQDYNSQSTKAAYAALAEANIKAIRNTVTQRSETVNHWEMRDYRPARVGPRP
jgi:RHS repeat-associated protein